MTTLTDECQQDFLVYLPPTTPPGPPPGFHCPTPSECPEIAYLGEPNVFRDVNTIPGVRFNPREVNTDFSLSVLNFALSVNASDGVRNVYTPQALGTGQFYYIEKADDSGNPVIINSFSGDLIGGDPLVVLGLQYANMAMMDVALGRWARFGIGAGPPIDLSNYARLDTANVFQDLNSLTGIRLRPITVTEDFDLDPLNFAYLVNAIGGPVTGLLPPATGSGQLFLVQKIDSSGQWVTTQAQGTDLIHDWVSVNFDTQYGNALLYDGAPGHWTNIGSTQNFLVIPDTPPATPLTLNEVIALLQSYGLCA